MKWLYLAMAVLIPAIKVHSSKCTDAFDWIHWDFICPGTVVCQADWPSQSGDYGNFYVSPIERSDVRVPDRSWLVISEGFENATRYATNVDGEIGETVVALPLGSGGGGGILEGASDKLQGRSDLLDDQCCVPTVDCWTLSMDLNQEPNNTIKHLSYENWEKFLCCLVDFWIPRPGCPNPPGFETPFKWQHPPWCAVDA